MARSVSPYWQRFLGSKHWNFAADFGQQMQSRRLQCEGLKNDERDQVSTV